MTADWRPTLPEQNNALAVVNTNRQPGLLNVDKPKDWTSHDVVAHVRRLSRMRQVGHTGTLDPMATGVLVLCVGWATRLAEYVMGLPKEYLAEIVLGRTTDTYDAHGQVLAQAPVPELTQEQLDAVLDHFRGAIEQRPPAYSAIKQQGEALYKRARRGEQVHVEARPVTIYELGLLAFDGHAIRTRIRCSSGTYIRSIAHDLGQLLGCGGYLGSLRRTAVGSFHVDDAISLATLETATSAESWAELLLPPAKAVAHLPTITFATPEAARLQHGQFIEAEAPQQDCPHQARDQDGNLLAIVHFDRQRQAWRPDKVLAGYNR